MRKNFRKILGCLTLLFLLTSCGGMTNSSEITKLETKETQQEKQQTNKHNVHVRFPLNVLLFWIMRKS